MNVTNKSRQSDVLLVSFVSSIDDSIEEVLLQSSSHAADVASLCWKTSYHFQPLTKMTIFCILSMKRCGSTLLLDLLDSHPNIRCFNGPFTWNPDHPPQEVYTDHGRVKNLTAFGFKILESQNRQWLLQVLENPNVPVILLTRANALRHFYSCRVASKTGIYTIRSKRELIRARWSRLLVSLRQRHWSGVIFVIRNLLQLSVKKLRGSDLYTPEMIKITKEELDHFIDETSDYFDALRQTLRRRGGRWIELSYEQFCGENRPATMLGLTDFLNLSEANLSTNTVKLNDRPLAELVENSCALRKHCLLRGIYVD